MSVAALQAFLSQVHPVEEGVLSEYAEHWSAYEVPRRTIMTSEGDTERYMYFVIEGIQKSYYLHDAKQHVIAFTYPPSFSGIPESFLTQTPSKYFLETATDSAFLRISFEEHQCLMKEHRAIETLFRIASEKLLIGTIERHYELMAYDIETRFKLFMSRSAHLINTISHKDLASYLRIDPTNFSKLLNSVRT